jgi:hypothetical protein
VSLADEPDSERPPGAIETALWCNRCMLPSACTWEAPVATPLGPTTVKVTVCIDCGSRLNENGDVVE